MDDDRRGLDGGSLLWPNSNARCRDADPKDIHAKVDWQNAEGAIFWIFWIFFLMSSDGCVADTSAMLELFTGGGKSSNGSIWKFILQAQDGSSAQ